MIKNFYFCTATILEWKHILQPDKYKEVIIESFKFLVKEKRVRIFAFVINYIHFNPVHPKWKLAGEPQQYKYSSAKFYYEDIDEFGILENYMDVLRDS